MTKKELSIYKSFLNARARELEDCYNSYSKAKYRAYEKVKYDMKKMNGQNLYIISHNFNMFTCAFMYANPNDNGNLYLRYYTRYNTYDIDLTLTDENQLELGDSHLKMMWCF